MTINNENNSQLYWVRDNIIAGEFPGIERALTEPDGLLAIGGDLNPRRLLVAYQAGIFPWNNHEQPILWWSPDPRWVLFPDQVKISRSLSRLLRSGKFNVTCNCNFEQVIKNCAEIRKQTEGTWITPALQSSFIELHRQGFAHSVETWEKGKLVGGLYGLAIGKIFFGESMFSRVSNASKTALAKLCELLVAEGFALIDCQVHTRHLESLGATGIPRRKFAEYLGKYCNINQKLQL